MKSVVLCILFWLPCFAFAGKKQPIQPLSNCELLLAGLEDMPLPPQYVQTNDNFELSAKKPKDGLGHLLVVKSQYRIGWPLVFLAQKFPEFFNQFDIYTDGTTLIMPDAVRLSALSKNGIQYRDFEPTQNRTLYGVSEFDEAIKESTWLLSTSLEIVFKHDRGEEHMLAALTMPRWMFEKARAHFLVEMEFADSELFKQHQDLRNSFVFRDSRDKLWDNFTLDFGKAIKEFGRDFHKEQTYGSYLHRLAKLINTFNTSFSALYDGVVSDWCRDQGPEIIYRRELRKKYQVDTVPTTESFALEEAIKVVHALTKIPVETLQEYYKKSGYKSLRDPL